MTRVDFYVLQKTDINDRWAFASRLINKVASQGHHITVMFKDQEEARKFDEYLWHDKPESFIPHTLQGNLDDEYPIILCHDTIPKHHHNVMVNLGLDISQEFSRYQRLLEIIIQQDDILTATRKNYKMYQSRGYETHMHKS